MKKVKFAIIIAFVILSLFSLQSLQAQMMHENTGSTMSKSDFKLSMRKLWEDHVMWTRNVILNIIDDLGGTDKAVERLLRNQDDIGNAVKSFYGSDAGKKLTELLREHIIIAGDLLKAAKTGDQTAFKQINQKWHDNADAIASFLAGANPNWNQNEMQTMMQNHLALTTDEAVARLTKDYASDITAYDKVHEEIIEMSDMLASGIILQFPEKFDK